jgi:sialic acid synthase SpsE/sugar phosphate isomerase/epimerase
MMIDREIAPLIVFSEDDLVSALRKISANKKGFVLCVSGSGQLQGVLTDGDVRRWLSQDGAFNLEAPAIKVANRNFTALPETADAAEIEACFSDRISFVPLIDQHHHLRAVAWRENAPIHINGREIGPNAPAYVIAEIGNNHNGSLELAKKLVDLAAQAGADCAKFQMRDMASLYVNRDAADASADLGAQYTLDLLARFQLTPEELVEAFDYCKLRGIQPLCTPWDERSLARLEEYGMPAYKLASADLTNHALLEAMAATRKVLICSTGMSTEDEIADAIAILRRHSSPFVLLHVNSTYPAPFKDVNLAYMDRLKRASGGVVGYSGHERGIAVAIAAVARGAKVIEKHFTIDRAMEGNDHRVSLLPDEFKAMVDGIREVEAAIGQAQPRTLTQGEMMNREVLAKSLVAARPIAAGDIIHDDDIAVRSPGQGLQPYNRSALVGRTARRDLAPGDVFFPSDVQEVGAKARHYSFRRPWGVPVRYHDLRRMAAATNLDLVEFHMSYKDMEVDLDRELGDLRLPIGLVVHSPELFASDHIMDLCSPDPQYRSRSVDELRRVVDITRRLAPYFTGAERPPIIINAGGFSADGPIPARERPAMYELIAESLASIDQAGVEILPQTMPPYPWHFGGQRYHNLFMTAEDIAAFSATYGYRVCLDISHSALAANHSHASFKDFLETVGPVTRHLHIVDAEGVDGEGLQIGEGSIDFPMVAEVLDRTAPAASFIPEIWQGHKDDGAGFWIALERLEKWF